MKAYYPALVALAGCCTSCFSPSVDSQRLLGSKTRSVHTTYYRDFLGVSSHGELFDFQECEVDTAGLNKLTPSEAFRRAPDFNLFQNFYKNRLQNVASTTWQKTPITPTDNLYFHTVLQFGNLQDDDHSKRVLQQDYLHTPGNFYAYFVAFPPGYSLYVLVPKEGKLFIIRKRG